MAAQPHVTALQGQFSLGTVEGLGLRQTLGTPFNQFHRGGTLKQVRQLAGQFHTTGARSHHGQTLQGLLPLAQLHHQLP